MLPSGSVQGFKGSGTKCGVLELIGGSIGDTGQGCGAEEWGTLLEWGSANDPGPNPDPGPGPDVVVPKCPGGPDRTEVGAVLRPVKPLIELDPGPPRDPPL